MIRKLLPQSVKRILKALILRVKGPEGTEGLPPGIALQELNKIAETVFGASIKHTVYSQLSAWKRSGTFRITASLDSGERKSLVFREERYDDEHIPALVGIPARPGASEHTVYSNADERFAKFLPRCYLVREVEAASHYQYLLQDLAPTHYTLSSTKLRRECVLTAARVLISLQRIGTEVFAGSKAYLINYDRSFTDSLLPYAEDSLRAYNQTAACPSISKLLEIWEDAARLLLTPSTASPSFLHGDYNPSNIHLPSQGGAGLKFVDWEWAGFGVPHADLTSLLKSVSPEVEAEALQCFADGYPEISVEEHGQIYRQAKAQRRLIDASFLAKQQMNPETSVDWIPGFIEKSAAAVSACVDQSR